MNITLVNIFIVGFIFGFCIMGIVRKLRGVSGTLKIDRHDPEKDVYRLEIDNLDDLSKKKIVVLKVDTKANLSQN